MLCIVGTVPSHDFPLLEGEATLRGDKLWVGATPLDVNRGTPALLAAAVVAAKTLELPPPHALLVGDAGAGKGSQALYAHLAENLPSRAFKTITFHYLYPIIHWHNRLLEVIKTLSPRPSLIADAGFMYVAKMSGAASDYDLFTPDVGELAFLADEKAPHPFYTRGFILHEDNRVPDLINRTYLHRNAARYLLVKGEKDCLADNSGILATVDNPTEDALEAIGGTGDTLTGLVSVMLHAGMEIKNAAVTSMRINRIAGQLAQPTPATQIIEIIREIPQARQKLLLES